MQTWGSDDLAYAPREKLLEMADPYERQVILVAKVGGDIVGTVDIALPLSENLDLAEFALDILPEFQGQGVAGNCSRPRSTSPATRAATPS